MVKNNIKKKLTQNSILKKIKFGDISFRYMLLDFLLLIIILVISYNVFLAYNRGVDNQAKLKEEEEKLARLQQENKELSEKENYFRSIEYRKAYARESLNLAGEGERLFLVVRDDEEVDLQEEDELYDKDSMQPLEHWKMLILRQ